MMNRPCCELATSVSFVALKPGGVEREGLGRGPPCWGCVLAPEVCRDACVRPEPCGRSSAEGQEHSERDSDGNKHPQTKRVNAAVSRLMGVVH